MTTSQARERLLAAAVEQAMRGGIADSAIEPWITAMEPAITRGSRAGQQDRPGGSQARRRHHPRPAA